MKYLLSLLVCCLLMSCGILTPYERFFCTISSKDIPDVSIKTIPFKTDYIDDDCVKCGTISKPLFDYDIKYDTLSHYNVVVLGYVVFGEENERDNQCEKIDSVGITRLVIAKSQSPRELYGKKGDDEWSNKRWEGCSLPKKILKKIKKDFLKRMKYTRFVFDKTVLNNESPIKGFTTEYHYSLY